MEEAEEEKMMEVFERLKRRYEIVKRAAEILRVQEEDLPRVLERFLKEIEEMKKS